MIAGIGDVEDTVTSQQEQRIAILFKEHLSLGLRVPTSLAQGAC